MRACWRAEQHGGPQVGWSYRVEAGGGIFIGVGGVFWSREGVSRIITCSLSFDGLPWNCHGAKGLKIKYAQERLMYLEVKSGSTPPPCWNQSVLSGLLSIVSLPTSRQNSLHGMFRM